MIKREPELLSLIELSVATEEVRQGKPLDVTAYRRQARAALRHGSSRAVEKELRLLLEMSTCLEKAGDWLNAGMVYHAVLDEIARGYNEMLHEIDEEGDITSLIDEFAAGLSRCLNKSKADDQTRQVWLEALLEAELADIEIGGVGLAPSARKTVLEQASDKEWVWIKKRVKDAISKSGDWAREELTRFLAERRKSR